MLIRLTIQNYAIIDELEIRFSEKLNVITGETGAGKSIIIGALGLILGERADSSSLVNKEKKCVIEGLFSPGLKSPVRKFLEDNDLDQAEEVIVRREISTTGKSRAFINDTPVNLSQIQQLSSLLVDLHQQFDTMEVTESDFQREVIDALAANAAKLKDFSAVFFKWHEVNREWEQLNNSRQQFEREADYNRFQYAELQELSLQPNELENIAGELKLLNNAEGIRIALDKVQFELSESDQPMVQQFKLLKNLLSPFEQVHPGLPGIMQRFQSLHIELQDIAGDISRLSSQVSYDPLKIAELNERLSAGYKLQKKHNVNSTEELLLIKQQLEEKLQAIINIDDLLTSKEKERNELFARANEKAALLSATRARQVKPLEEKVNKLLVQVGMPNARLKVSIAPADLNSTGADKIEFLFNANVPTTISTKNPQEKPEFLPVRKVASGGELSRLMLCIKSLVARSVDLPTLIFDEIDTGISGEAARQVGAIMKDLAVQRQVICITHQPQIAGRADHHFFVYKEIRKDAVHTNVRILNTEERITAIAKMLSGEKPTAAAIENAREMLMN